ncbi:hypothetical protein PAXRUDRAFT_21667 [Paxillus rubicundulus Ve08.2h10]|uniref:Uncharacterized protein n=1 Tax=Paxillus rubicundulus Ve08.2h10 TaxID=930991 RepID=A0A0D0BLZ5_9AGAM|nr:hypothetical protein PAXRUDRAFT_21667 [Paxillus rubicundulus Ve08.2h10]
MPAAVFRCKVSNFSQEHFEDLLGALEKVSKNLVVLILWTGHPSQGPSTGHPFLGPSIPYDYRP